MSEDLNTFKGDPDRYNGVTVNSIKEPCEDSVFSDKLSGSLIKWEKEEKKCIWFKVNIKNATWVPVLAQNGFNFHHARDDFVMMYKWILRDVKSNLPPASHTNVGVGGMVFNDQNQILVVTERNFEYAHWKLPGGYVERGEDIQNAAIREVKEETGIDAVFESMVTFRHTHDTMFGNSDIYVVVLLRAINSVIQKCETEIKDCVWMDIDEFLEHPHVYEFNRFLVQQALTWKNKKLKLNLKKEKVKFAKWSKEITAVVLEEI